MSKLYKRKAMWKIKIQTFENLPSFTNENEKD